jgi:hypothetical protein
MKHKLLLLGILLLSLSSCSCGSSVYSTDVKPVQKTDKELSCKDIVMELNEAEFYKKAAEERKKGRIEDIIFPYCYPAGYLNANKAEKLTVSRLEYLNQIYELNDCAAKSKFESRKLPPPPTSYQDVPPPSMKNVPPPSLK